jgi:hypothetical protein
VEIVIGLALAALFIGGITLFGRAGSTHVRRTLLATPEGQANGVRDGARVVLRGRARPTNEGPVASPLTGKKVVWWRVRVQLRSPAARTQTGVVLDTPAWRTVHEEIADRDIILAEPGGSAAHVLMQAALVHANDVSTTEGREEVERFFRDRVSLEETDGGVDSDGEPKNLSDRTLPNSGPQESIPIGVSGRIIEETIEEGAELWVLGTANRAAPAGDAYRGTPAAAVSVFVGGIGEGVEALLVASEDVRTLLREERFGMNSNRASTGRSVIVRPDAR